MDIVRELESYGSDVDVHDPWVDPEDAQSSYGLTLTARPEHGVYDAVVIAVAHREIKAMGAEGIRSFGREPSVVYDIKYVLPASDSDDRL